MEIATGTVLKSVLGNLGSFVAQEYALIKGIRGEIQFLTDELSSLNAYVGSLVIVAVDDDDDDDGGHAAAVNTQQRLRDVERQARDVAFDIQDCIDEFDHRLIKKTPRGDGVGFLPAARRFLHDAAGWSSRRDIAGKVAELKARVQHIADRRVRYGIVVAPSRRCWTRHQQTQRWHLGLHPWNPVRVSFRKPFVRKSDFVGGYCSFMDGAGSEVGVACFAGPGGMGNTTRAMQLFKDLGDAFHLRAWVTIPHQFSVGAVVRSILRQIMSQAADTTDLTLNVETMTQVQLDSLLGELLKDKRYLICLDDLPSTSTWEAIAKRLPHSKYGRRIIVTTRFPPVADKCREVGAVGVTMLAYPILAESAKQIFEGCLADILGDSEYGATLEIKDSILEICNRHPLFIVMLAGFVASNSWMSSDRIARLLLPPPSRYPPGRATSSSSATVAQLGNRAATWALYKIAHHEEEVPSNYPSVNIFGLEDNRILDIFFNNLPCDVKACLLYLSLFPKACIISRRQLARHWIAQGLVGEIDAWSAEDVADACFEELVRRNMVRPVKRSSTGKVKTCQVHTTVLEYIVTKSTKENFTTVISDYWSLPIMSSSMKVRRLSLQGSDQQVYKRRTNHSLLDLSHVRVVTASGPLEHLPFLPFELKIVEVLDLEGCIGFRSQDVKSICQMLLLKYFSLRETDVDKLPSDIGKLKYLETLDIRDTDILELPKSVVHLGRIKNILGGSKRARKALKLPEDIMKKPMRSLNVLSGIEISGESAPQLDKFMGIRKLAIYKLRIKESDQSFSVLLHSIGNLFSSSLHSLVIVDEFSDFLKSLDGLRFLPRSLSSLELYGELHTLPEFTTFLQFLKKLSIPMTTLRAESTLQILGELPSLLCLTFSFGAPQMYWDTEDIVERNEPKGEIIFPGKGFRSLKLLRFSAPSLPALRFAEGAGKEVERLELRYKKLEGLTGVGNLPKIREVHFFVKAQARESTRHILDTVKTELAGSCAEVLIN